jgi:hypothetical protein
VPGQIVAGLLLLVEDWQSLFIAVAAAKAPVSPFLQA